MNTIIYNLATIPKTVGRIIFPHTLACTPMRWYAMAYCEKNGDYRDFVLSRFRGVPDVLDKSDRGAEFDLAWQNQFELSIAPDPRLEPLQQEVICHDFGMKDGR